MLRSRQRPVIQTRETTINMLSRRQMQKIQMGQKRLENPAQMKDLKTLKAAKIGSPTPMEKVMVGKMRKETFGFLRGRVAQLMAAPIGTFKLQVEVI